jgi:hypothetical protein
MENFLRDGVDLQVMSSGTIAGDAHFFDDATTPSKVRQYLDSSKVNNRQANCDLRVSSFFVSRKRTSLKE